MQRVSDDVTLFSLLKAGIQLQRPMMSWYRDPSRELHQIPWSQMYLYERLAVRRDDHLN